MDIFCLPPFFGVYVSFLEGRGLRQGFSVASEPILELALVEQAGLELTEILPSAGTKGVCHYGPAWFLHFLLVLRAIFK